MKFPHEPGADEEPIAFDGGERNTELFCDFFEAQASEDFEFHEPSLAGIEFAEFF